MEKLVLSRPEAAEILGVSLPTLDKFSHRADFPWIRVGRRVLIPVDALREWLAKEASKHDPIL